MSERLEDLNADLVDRYRLERELGLGGMARVYLAEDLKHHRKVALKVLRPDVAAALGAGRLLREIEIAANLTHTNIVPVYDSGEAAGLLFYVMPFLDGKSLRDHLHLHKVLALDEAYRITEELADALSYAHACNVVHCDIKPENVLLVAGHAVISDFGIALAIGRAESEALTRTGLVFGTPTYMSPEQAVGGGLVDARSDLYALGCVLYEMLAGDPPFSGSTTQSVLARKLAEAPPRLRTVRDAVPEAVEAVVLKAIARVPADRFKTCGEFAAALTSATTAGQPPARIGRLTTLHRRVAVAATALLLLGGALTWTLWRYTPWIVDAGPSDPQGSLRILSADPAPGSVLGAADLARGVPIRVVVEHAVPSAFNPENRSSLVVQLWVLHREADAKSPDGIWRPLASRAATWETRQLGLSSTIGAKDVHGGRVALRAVLGFKSPDGSFTFGHTASATLEYEVQTNK